MTLNQNPFSVYDFLGYLVPGMLCAIGIVFINQNPYVFSFLVFSKFGNYTEGLVVLILCYLLGHLLSFLSSITIEKYSVWTLGYPSKYLFKQKKDNFWLSIVRKYEPEHKYGSIFRILFRIIIKTIISIAIFPITVLDIVVRHLFRLYDQYARPFDNDLISIVGKSLDELLSIKFKATKVCGTEEDEHDYFRIVYHYALEKAQNHNPKMQNYVSLYGFTRTTSFIFVSLFWYCLFVYCRNCYLVDFWYIPMLIGLISFILYIDFNKFYRKYSVEAVMAATVSYKTE